MSDAMYEVTRRQFIRTSATVAAGSLAVGTMTAQRGAHAAGSDAVRVGLIGCGGRGTGAAFNALEASSRVRVVALADVFADRLDSCRMRLLEAGDRAVVADEHCYTGFDAYRELLADDVDVVILATPPHFRPIHFAEAVDAGRHVFMEKPAAVDPTGIRVVLAAAAEAERRNLSVVAGTQRRHELSYQSAIKRIHGGLLGSVMAARCYWNMGGLWMHPRQPGWSDMEWQLRNWLYFTWLSGDHIVEQHVHNLDAINWVVGTHPVRALGLGGRQVRTDPAYGHIFDHFAVEYEYPNGVFLTSMCRQIDGCPGRVEEVVRGTHGTAILRSGHAVIECEDSWRFEGDNPNPYVQEHRDLIDSIDRGAGHNEARQVAESTLTAIMGRMSAYTGQPVSWEQALDSSLDLSPDAYEFGDLPTPSVAIPGRTPLI